MRVEKKILAFDKRMYDDGKAKHSVQQQITQKQENVAFDFRRTDIERKKLRIKNEKMRRLKLANEKVLMNLAALVMDRNQSSQKKTDTHTVFEGEQ